MGAAAPSIEVKHTPLRYVLQRTDSRRGNSQHGRMSDRGELTSAQVLILRRVADGWALPPRLLRPQDVWADVDQLRRLGLAVLHLGTLWPTALGIETLADRDQRAIFEEHLEVPLGAAG